MINDWLNQNPNDGFDPNDHDIEMDEIAKLYAMADMKEDQELWAREQANKFYNDFEGLDIKSKANAIKPNYDFESEKPSPYLASPEEAFGMNFPTKKDKSKND